MTNLFLFWAILIGCMGFALIFIEFGKFIDPIIRKLKPEYQTVLGIVFVIFCVGTFVICLETWILI